MPRAVLPSGVEIEYETYGDVRSPTLLCVSGFTTQMLGWEQGFVELLAEQGLHVVRFDNRDVGLSTKFDGQQAQPMVVLDAVLKGEPIPEVPYTLSDMGDDAIGLLDHLGVDRVHIAGNSMGGMIVQTMAIEHPERIASLTSIMSSPGDPRAGAPTKEARAALLAPPAADRAGAIEQALDAQVWGSKKYWDPERLQARDAAQFDRCNYPEGAPRQLAAIYASGDRSGALRELDCPTLVIHGRDDTLIQLDGGELTAELIPGSVLLVVSDMGHDFPVPLWPMLAEAIGGHVRVAEQRVAHA